MTVNLNAFGKEIAVSGLGEFEKIPYLRNGVQELCRHALLWKNTLGTEDVDTPSDQEEPVFLQVPSVSPNDDFVLPEGSRIYLITDVKIDGESLVEKGGEGKPYTYSKVTKLLCIETHFLANGGEVEVEAALEPTDDTSTIPDFLAQWKGAILDWARHEIYGMANREWYNSVASADSLRSYKIRTGQAVKAEGRENTTQPLRVSRSPF